MSTSAKEMAEHHEQIAKIYAEVAQRYPDAVHGEIDGALVAVTRKLVDHDHIVVSGDNVWACERFEADGAWIAVVRSRMVSPTILAVKFLKEKHPEAYAGLIKWLVRG